MSVALVALLGSAIYETRSQSSELESLDGTLDLISRAKGDASLTFEANATELVVNGVPLDLAAPGAALVRQALLEHQTMRLVLPAKLSTRQIGELVELYASAAGLYGSIDDFRDALRATIPDIVVSASAAKASEGDLREAIFEMPGLRATTSLPGSSVRPPDPHNAGLADLTARLDPLLQSAAAARDSHDYVRLAQVLAQLRELEDGSSEDLAAMVARERRRVISAPVLEAMARVIPKPGGSPQIARILGLLGDDGASALFNALIGAPGPYERRAYLDALVDGRDCVDSIIAVLGNPVSRVLRDAAEIAGRRRLERAVPALSNLLRHADVEVRTAAWHALELIGTPAAIKALRS